MTQRFIEFVMMQAQNAALFLGQMPNPQTGKPEVNLEVAKMFIDQLAMIQEKTRGNLSNEEGAVLKNTLASLQMAYVEMSGGSAAAAVAPKDEPAQAAPAPAPAGETTPPVSSGSEAESRKKFTKSYGS